jgi:hypothetical protein
MMTLTTPENPIGTASYPPDFMTNIQAALPFADNSGLKGAVAIARNGDGDRADIGHHSLRRLAVA